MKAFESSAKIKIHTQRKAKIDTSAPSQPPKKE